MNAPEQRTLVYRAGIIPYYVDESGEIKMMFMVPSDPTYGGDRYQIAKGRIDADDADARSAALREGSEELGLFIGNTVVTEEVGVFLGRTTMFVTKVIDQTMFGHPDFETESTKWMTLDQFMIEGRDLHKPVVQACYRVIEQIEGR
jgi:8-oxo-dGTP pyrophosphatase MutT (NUDIX family)